MKIVSLFPAATEIVYALGLDEQLCGVSCDCDYPASAAEKLQLTRSNITAGLGAAAIDEEVRELSAGGAPLYELDVESLSALQPDVVLTQATCDVCAVPEEEVRRNLQDGTTRVVALNPGRLADLFEAIVRVGEVCHCDEKAKCVAADLERRVRQVQLKTTTVEPRNVLMLEWLAPPFSAGHWNPELVEFAGGTALAARIGERSREITWSEVEQLSPDVVVVTCCGFDVQRVLAEAWQAQVKDRFDPRVSVWAVDGNHLFNRPGPRLVDSLELLASILHPTLCSRPADFDLLAEEIH